MSKIKDYDQIYNRIKRRIYNHLRVKVNVWHGLWINLSVDRSGLGTKDTGLELCVVFDLLGCAV